MARQRSPSVTDSGVRPRDDSAASWEIGERLPLKHSHSDPTPNRYRDLKDDRKVEELSSHESRDIIEDSFLAAASQNTNAHYLVSTFAGQRQSSSTFPSSPEGSRPNSPFTIPSHPSAPSTATTASIDPISERKATGSQRRPSILSRLKSSISTFQAVPSFPRPPSIQPCDFRKPPENPEKHFIDSIGVVIPGVCNRGQCDHPLSHFIIQWRICEPVEYTTALADHGITYNDYCRLLSALKSFLDEIPNEPKAKAKADIKGGISSCRDTDDPIAKPFPGKLNVGRISSESLDHFKRSEQRATNLNELLADITYNWRLRGLPVFVCVGSFSLFSPNRVSGSVIQVLHVPLKHRAPYMGHCGHNEIARRLSIVDPVSGLIRTHELEEARCHSVSMPRRPYSDQSDSPPLPASPVTGPIFHHHQLHRRDRSRPWSLWPNAIPTQKRGLMEGHADRYGVDPYFRGWMRANINSRTTTTSYAKYMIEKEDDPFVNTRLDYVHSPPNRALLRKLLTKGYKDWKAQGSSMANRGRYEHNRRLECRKTVEGGSRLRLVRFAFRNPIYPPYTPEMSELGLCEGFYNHMIARIEEIRKTEILKKRCSLRMLRRRSAGNALTEVSAWIREVNAMGRNKVVWTIEKIPGVYDTYLGRRGKEWEISAWNAEDPLELLLQLEKWGIIEKKLGLEDDE